MARLPISRVVDVTLTKLDRFATRRGFGIPLILTSESTGPINATTRTKVYGAIEEVAADWADTTEAYKAALVAFSQNPRPRQIKLGFCAAGAYAGSPAPTFTAEMDAIWNYDQDWYWLGTTAAFRDKAALDTLFQWVDAHNVLMIQASNDVLTESSVDTTTVAARNKNLRTRTAIFYHPSALAAEYPDIALIAYAARRDFETVGSAYTAKFKKLRTISAANVASAAVQGATGFTPAIGLSAVTGHFANMYINLGGLNMVVEGTMLDGGFIDELHAADWIIARTEEEMLSTLANSENGRIPYTNRGMQQLVAAVEGVLNRAFVAGLVADVEDPETGELNPAYEISVERVEAIPTTQRRQRIAPVIDARFRYTGAVHYASARFVMTF